jgi:hypothetical protein
VEDGFPLSVARQSLDVAIARREARMAGCEWLPVDFEEHLQRFYIDSCGFSRGPAGIIVFEIAQLG